MMYFLKPLPFILKAVFETKAKLVFMLFSISGTIKINSMLFFERCHFTCFICAEQMHLLVSS
jgi:hypothetical protein